MDMVRKLRPVGSAPRKVLIGVPVASPRTMIVFSPQTKNPCGARKGWQPSSRTLQQRCVTSLFLQALMPTNSVTDRQRHQIGMKSCRSFDHIVGAQQEGYNSIPPLAVVFNLCDRRFDTSSGCMTWHLMKK
jgi:hypothetical protein